MHDITSKKMKLDHKQLADSPARDQPSRPFLAILQFSLQYSKQLGAGLCPTAQTDNGLFIPY